MANGSLASSRSSFIPSRLEDVGRVGLRFEQKTPRIDQDMAFTTVICLPPSSPPMQVLFHRLSIDNSCGEGWGSRLGRERRCWRMALLSSFQNGLPGWEVVRQQAPGAAAANDIEGGFEDPAQGMNPRASFGLRSGGKMWLYTGQSGVGEVCMVCFSHRAR